MFHLFHAIIDKLPVNQAEKDELHAQVAEVEPAKDETDGGSSNE